MKNKFEIGLFIVVILLALFTSLPSLLVKRSKINNSIMSENITKTNLFIRKPKKYNITEEENWYLRNGTYVGKEC